MPASANHSALRLTMAQALVKYLQVQFSERDGRQRRLIHGMFGIFGHGNVAGLGQALFEYGVLCRHANRALARMAVVTETR